jgi:hypothetical protein
MVPKRLHQLLLLLDSGLYVARSLFPLLVRAGYTVIGWGTAQKAQSRGLSSRGTNNKLRGL